MMMDSYKMIIMKLFVIMMSLMMVSTTNTVKMERMTHSKEDSVNNARIGVLEVEKSWPMSDEFKAILGGVLGFWGGVGSMGTVFLLVVLTQRYCCRRRGDKDEAGL